MLRLTYQATTAGAPADYGDLEDKLISGGNDLQIFPKARVGLVPAEDRLSAAVDAWLAARTDKSVPVVVMVHGYLFNPSSAQDSNADSPFSSIYGPPPGVNHHMSWLPLVGECDDYGAARHENAIAFSYRSIGTVSEVGDAGWVNSYQHAVFDLAPLAARALATILVLVAFRVPAVRVLAHSLGTRTTSQAIRLARARLAASLDRIVLLDGAEFCVDAAANFANCAFDVFNIVNRTDAVLRFGAEKACHPLRENGSLAACAIGYEGLGGNDRWLDLRLDKDDLVNWFANGLAPDGVPYTINARANEDSHQGAGLDHWSCYTNDGNRALVRDLLFSDVMTVARMKAHAVPLGTGAPAFGMFNGQTIPLTPQSRMERQRLLAQAMGGDGGGSGD